MAAKELKKAAENLTCPVCYQVFKNPKYLPCHHSCCEECLEKMQRKESKITCPECRLETTVPPGGVRDLPSNFLINRLVDELILKRTVDGEEEVQCDKCEVDDPVVSYCPECGDFLCHVCNASHKRDKRSRDHKIVPLTELRANKGATLEVKAKIPSCKEHEYELKHYCETCEELVCLYCTMKGHNDHSHDTVKKIAGKHRNKLKEITAPVDEMIRGLTEAYDNIDKARKNIKQHSNEVDKEIDQYYDELVQQLMEQKQQIKQQLHDKVSQKEKALTMQLEEIEFAQGEVFSMKELKDAVEKSSDHETLSAKKQIITRMTKLSEKYSELNFLPVETTTIKYITNKQVLQQFSELNFINEEVHHQLPHHSQQYSQQPSSTYSNQYSSQPQSYSSAPSSSAPSDQYSSQPQSYSSAPSDQYSSHPHSYSSAPSDQYSSQTHSYSPVLINNQHSNLLHTYSSTAPSNQHSGLLHSYSSTTPSNQHSNQSYSRESYRSFQRPKSHRKHSYESEPIKLIRPSTTVEAPGERQKCRQCKDFFANEEYGDLCSVCFKNLTIKESTQKCSKYKSPSYK